MLKRTIIAVKIYSTANTGIEIKEYIYDLIKLEFSLHSNPENIKYNREFVTTHQFVLFYKG